jgi:hypothetical protein
VTNAEQARLFGRELRKAEADLGGRGPAGFAVLVGTQRPMDVACNKVVALSFTPEQLKRLHARIAELLRVVPERSGNGNGSAPIDGIVLGDNPKGDGA